MTDTTPYWSKESLLHLAARAKRIQELDPAGVLKDASARIKYTRFATGVMEDPVPFFFEDSDIERGVEQPDGPVKHGYDASGRIVLVERPLNALGTTERTVYRYQEEPGESINTLTIERVGGRTTVPRSGLVGSLSSDIRYYVVSGTNSTAYVWRVAGHQVLGLQVWDLRWPAPYVVEPAFDKHGQLLQLKRDGEIIWPRRQRSGRPLKKKELRQLADQTLALTRELMRTNPEPVLLFSLCFEMNNSDYLPPPLGVVFERDAAVFAKDPRAYSDGPAALLNPTFQECYAFPTQTAYPYAEIASVEDKRFAWSDRFLKQNAIGLVDNINAMRRTDDPPFLLLDLEDDAMAYFSRLPPKDQEHLQQWGIC